MAIDEPALGTSGRPAVLLDRDGTVIVESNYLCDPAGVALETGAAAGLQVLAASGYVLAVITNQSGIARGRFGWAQTEMVNARVAALLKTAGVDIAGWFVCPHGPADGCACRKPRAGLALAAAAVLGLDLSRSWIVGDKQSDIAAADAVGARGVLMLTGHGGNHAAWARAAGHPVAATLHDAAGLILKTDAARVPGGDQRPLFRRGNVRPPARPAPR
ncbi:MULTISPECIES: D-glycero-alpha-D-manno-heptose-1,7-bisphosphate 7-phosphatase [Sphingomonas]|uniref:D,D-heptose 1,7-bisphosphate phosphatase n=2 Tax=Sphingomonas TaxID=13687 RepID=A0A7Y7QXB8_9SPHN|nr:MULTISPECIES: HAD-IIIA family hydrolase [Sphingomonas]MBZ6383110.1 HAD-IIIA family hydrolase [Sphingomonas sanguinis]NNG48162.1 HAD-IIIA family hydrolase [Sphingomonas sanguinis]NNG54908.1 HAD-IIIA family hydrolase [Sphingomonas sanguinis]NVP32407.1 HAD-IIIA family hydrolase [Sphingomonas sanguinis]